MPKKKSNRVVMIDLEAWCRFCDALKVSPDTAIEDVILQVEYLIKARTKYAQEVFRPAIDLGLLPYEIAEKLPEIGGKFGELAGMCKTHVAAKIESIIQASSQPAADKGERTK